ncbi:MAG: deoxyguanosinetriphosphate triphosphohydrolase [Clostridia bacterium]|nr:deoxyguanosinetriphosphate triphosphohydrolase [Clostridia bacterium]
MTIRERYEAAERGFLSENATFSADTRGRDIPEEPSLYRTAFQRDRDRVLHSKSFRRLKHKTQVFLSPEGDHYRTRLTHTLEVSQIARTIARALSLNEDLTEAIALAHDLGHTPFGHAGERALNSVIEGGFRHYEQSVRVVERLERDGAGLNLTWEVRDGILHHTKGEEAATPEGRIVRFADRIAYIHHDMDDAVRAGILKEEDVPLPIREALGQTRGERLDCLIASLIENGNEHIGMAPDIEEKFVELHTFMYDALYYNPVAKSEEGKVEELIRRLYGFFSEHPEQLPEEYHRVYQEEGACRAACDYVSGMSDNFALSVYHEVYIPRGWSVTHEQY